VYSTDLSDENADLKVLARLLNLNGQAGRDALAGFSEGNFEATTATPVPEPTSFLLVASGIVAWIGRSAFRRPRLHV
jgi:hypothetical protein